MTADRYFRTGDIGVADELGSFKIVDRKKDASWCLASTCTPTRWKTWWR